MNSIKSCIAVCGLLLFFIACNQLPQNKNKAESPSHANSATYKPPVFANDERAEKIKDIAPQIHKLIEEHAKNRNIPGIAYGIVVDNELVISNATGIINLEMKIPSSPISSFRIASMTKSFTAMAILKLRDQAKLSLSDPVEKYISHLMLL